MTKNLNTKDVVVWEITSLEEAKMPLTGSSSHIQRLEIHVQCSTTPAFWIHLLTHCLPEQLCALSIVAWSGHSMGPARLDWNTQWIRVVMRHCPALEELILDGVRLLKTNDQEPAVHSDNSNFGAALHTLVVTNIHFSNVGPHSHSWWLFSSLVRDLVAQVPQLSTLKVKVGGYNRPMLSYTTLHQLLCETNSLKRLHMSNLVLWHGEADPDTLRNTTLQHLSMQNVVWSDSTLWTGLDRCPLLSLNLRGSHLEANPLELGLLQNQSLRSIDLSHVQCLSGRLKCVVESLTYHPNLQSLTVVNLGQATKLLETMVVVNQKLGTICSSSNNAFVDLYCSLNLVNYWGMEDESTLVKALASIHNPSGRYYLLRHHPRLLLRQVDNHSKALAATVSQLHQTEGTSENVCT